MHVWKWERHKCQFRYRAARACVCIRYTYTTGPNQNNWKSVAITTTIIPIWTMWMHILKMKMSTRRIICSYTTRSRMCAVSPVYACVYMSAARRASTFAGTASLHRHVRALSSAGTLGFLLGFRFCLQINYLLIFGFRRPHFACRIECNITGMSFAQIAQIPNFNYMHHSSSLGLMALIENVADSIPFWFCVCFPCNFRWIFGPSNGSMAGKMGKHSERICLVCAH